MAAMTQKSIIYHIPKCGGTYVKEAIRHSKVGSGPAYWRCHENNNHQEFNLKREHATPDRIIDKDKEGKFAFCFVRHPVTWYKSFWCFRVKRGGTDPMFPLDHCWDDDYEKFILNVLDKYPDGFVSQLYRYYDLDTMDFIGRQESLTEDLVKVLNIAGEEFDELDLRKQRRVNASATLKRFGGRAVISKELEDRIIEAERWAVGEFYD